MNRAFWGFVALGYVVGSLSFVSAATLSDDAKAVMPDVLETYRYLHENPELGKQEMKAHDFLTAKLRALGYTEFVPSTQAPTAVIAVLDSGRPGPVVALRAEMDARPLESGVNEPIDHDPRSKIDGVMHNCGHDAHAAMLLGAAEVLIHNRDKIAGKVVILFQPAEETPGGADDIVREGLLTKLGVQKIFAAHSAPGMAVGAIAASPGATLAGSNYFHIVLKGRGSHAAAPYDGDDLPVLASELVQRLSYFPARRTDIANRPMVVSVTKVNSDGHASNVLPATAEISGTVRAFEVAAASGNDVTIEAMLRAEVDRFSADHGVTYQWEFHVGSPPTINDQALFSEVAPLLATAWSGTFDRKSYKGMFSEDFAYYTPYFSSLYFSLGVAQDGLGNIGVHSAGFTISPNALPHGVELLALLARISTVGAASWDK